MRKKVIYVFWIVTILGLAIGCESKFKIEDQMKENLETIRDESESSECNEKKLNIEFPAYFEKRYEKVNFNTEVRIEEDANLCQLYRYIVKRANYNIDLAYKELYENVEIQELYEGEGIGEYNKPITYKSYTGNNNEMLYIDGEMITYSLPFSKYILQCVHTDSTDPRCNMDLYKLNENLEFMSMEEGLEQIYSLLKNVGFECDLEFKNTIYALNYNVLEEEEYAIDINGNEDVSRYKEEWTEEDNCYYYFLRQKIGGLPVYYVYGDIFKELDICNAPIQIIYGQNGIQRLDLDKLFEVEEITSEVSLMSLNDLGQVINSQYEMIITDDKFEVTNMELHMMAQKNDDNMYDLFPVWIISLDQIKNNDGEETRITFQNVIDAETGMIIS